MTKEVKPGRYRHFKGGEYEVFSEAVHTETGEELVFYQDSKGKSWARPKGMFWKRWTLGGKSAEI